MHKFNLHIFIGDFTVRKMTPKAGNPFESKKQRLFLSLKRNRKEHTLSSSRFVAVSDKDVEKATKGVVPDNTVRSNAWAI